MAYASFKKLTLGIGAIVVAAAVHPVHADQATAQDIADLKRVQQHLEQQARSTKPAAAAPLRREADRLQGVIEALERGEHVDPSALNPAAGYQK